MQRAKIAVRTAFFANGLGIGAIYARLPDMKSALILSNSQIGTALLFSSLGVLLAITQAGKLCARNGSRPIVIISSFLAPVILIPISLANTFPILCLSFVFWGAVFATQDVAMNTHASTLEHIAGQRYMSGFHAIFSLGALFGGFIGGIASQFKVTLIAQNLLISGLYLILATVVRNWWLSAESDSHQDSGKSRVKRNPIYIFIGLLGLAASINEGAAGDWGGILARDTFHVSPFLSALPYVFFNVAMVIGRFSGDKLATKFGAIKILTAAGLISGCGLTLGILVGGIGGQIFGWTAIGTGMSVVIPMVFSLAAETARSKGNIAPAQAVAIASGISYSGFMMGPPFMGFISSAITLRWAMLIPAALAISLAIGSRFVRHN